MRILDTYIAFIKYRDIWHSACETTNCTLYIIFRLYEYMTIAFFT